VDLVFGILSVCQERDDKEQNSIQNEAYSIKRKPRKLKPICPVGPVNKTGGSLKLSDKEPAVTRNIRRLKYGNNCMRSATSIIRRIAIELWLRSRPTFYINHKQGKFAVPGTSRNSSRLVESWRPTFKSQVIEYFLAGGQNGTVFVDIGANVGQTLVDFLSVRKVGDRYVGFEPNTACLEQLRAMLEANNCRDVTLVPVGLSDEPGLLRLYVGADDPGDSGGTIVEQLRPEKSVRETWIPCLVYDDIINTLVTDRVAIVKIDVEGAELAVLRGMEHCLAHQRPPILCEVLHRDPAAPPEPYCRTIRELQGVLEKANYNILRIMRSADDSKVVGLEPVLAFPSQVYDQRSALLCDYLFLPHERKTPIFS
jgi:FkbM family methyltransferase